MKVTELYPVMVITAVLCSLTAKAEDLPVPKKRLVVCYQKRVPENISYGLLYSQYNWPHLFVKTNENCTHVIIRSSGNVDPETAYYSGLYSVTEYKAGGRYTIHSKVMQNMKPVKNDYAEGFNVLSTKIGRSILINTCIASLRKNSYDGLDVVVVEKHLSDIIQLLLEMRPEFDRYNLSLSAIFPANLTQKVDLSNVSSKLDFISIKSFLEEKTENVTALSAPLYADVGWSVDYSVNLYISMGVPKEKIVLGIPTFGVSHKLANPEVDIIGSSAFKKGKKRGNIHVDGQLELEEIGYPVENAWRFYRDNVSDAPYASSYLMWASYDDNTSVKAKAHYIKKKGLAGAMLWPSEHYDNERESLPFANTLKATFGE